MGKETVRDGVWETNSSSMHSLIMRILSEYYSEKELREDIYVNKDGILSIWDRDLRFGRYPFQILCTFYEKVCYAIASFCGGYYFEPDESNDEEFAKIEEIVKKYIPEIKHIKVEPETVYIYEDDEGNEYTVKSPHVHTEKTGSDWKIYYYNVEEQRKIYLHETEYAYTDCPNYGYVDHESVGLLQGFLKKKGISLEEFLTNKRYQVVIDGDEYCDLQKYIKHHIIDTSTIEEYYPRDYFDEEELG